MNDKPYKCSAFPHALAAQGTFFDRWAPGWARQHVGCRDMQRSKAHHARWTCDTVPDPDHRPPCHDSQDCHTAVRLARVVGCWQPAASSRDSPHSPCPAGTSHRASTVSAVPRETGSLIPRFLGRETRFQDAGQRATQPRSDRWSSCDRSFPAGASSRESAAGWASRDSAVSPGRIRHAARSWRHLCQAW